MRYPNAALTLSVLVSAFSLFVPSAQAKAPPEAYTLRGIFRSVEISPNGQYVAMLAQQVDQPVVTISKIGGTTCKVGSGGSNLMGVFWANDSRLIIVAHKVAEQESEGSDNLRNISQAFSVDVNCGDAKKMNGSTIVGRSDDGQLIMEVPAIDDGNSDDKNLRRWRKFNGYKTDLFIVNPATGKGEDVERGAETTYRFLLDEHGHARMRFDVDLSSGKTLSYARIGDSKTWTLVRDERDTSTNDNSYRFLAIGRDPDTALVRTRNGGDRAGIYVFDFKTKQIIRPMFVRADADAVGLTDSTYSNLPTGVVYAGDNSAIEYFDPLYAKIQADLKETFPGEKRAIESVSKDGKSVIAFVEGATNPGGVYYFIDADKGDLIELVKMRPLLTVADVGPVKFYHYAARDGYSVPAYLTLPNGSSGKNLPLVVLPHGGPESRDHDDFDAWTQFLASRGYAVLQPQFRGSDGFGKAHRDAGRRQWGLRMQDDITDGVHDLITTGVADPKRICIVGWSYGGYAALAGLAYTPDLYRCGVAGAPVSDIPKMIEWQQKNGGRWFRDTDEITLMIGSLAKDEERLVKTSPSRNADKIQAPLMLVHGRLDTTVPLEQSQIMADAMKAAGKPYQMRIIEGDDHNLKKESTGVEFLKILESFLGENLK